MFRNTFSLAATLAAALFAFGAHAQPASPGDEPIQPIRPAVVTDPAKVELGKKLFFDPRLSRSGFISCNSCHNLGMGGTDHEQRGGDGKGKAHGPIPRRWTRPARVARGGVGCSRSRARARLCWTLLQGNPPCADC